MLGKPTKIFSHNDRHIPSMQDHVFMELVMEFPEKFEEYINLTGIEDDFDIEVKECWLRWEQYPDLGYRPSFEVFASEPSNIDGYINLHFPRVAYYKARNGHGKILEAHCYAYRLLKIKQNRDESIRRIKSVYRICGSRD